jgi:hypothetical protein
MHAPQPRVTPRRTIRFWLNCLVIACIVPALIVTTLIIYQSFNQERAGLERDTVGTARALSQAVDAELAGIRSALLVLSKSSNLASGDLARFDAEARQVVRTLNIDNIVLSDVRGQQLVNTLRAFGTPLPLHDREEVQRAIAAGQPVISDLFIGAVSQKPVLIIAAPVLAGGETRYALAFGIFPARLNEILQRQKMPPDWVAAIVDSSDTIVARTIGGDEFIGKKVSADLKRELAAASEGFFEGKTIEGIPVLSSFSRSQVSGWSVAIGIPKATLLGALWQALLSNVFAALLLLAGGTLLARRISGRIADSIHALRGPAIEMGSAGPLVVPPVAIQEAHLLGQSLVAAHGLVQQRTAERDDLRRRLMSAQVSNGTRSERRARSARRSMRSLRASARHCSFCQSRRIWHRATSPASMRKRGRSFALSISTISCSATCAGSSSSTPCGPLVHRCRCMTVKKFSARSRRGSLSSRTSLSVRCRRSRSSS